MQELEDLTVQEPGEENARAAEVLKERGVNFDDAYRAFNNGDHAYVEDFLATIAPPARHMVEALERRINETLRRHIPAPASPAVGLVARRPRERRAASRVRARAPDDDPEPEPARRPPLDPEERLGLRRSINRAVRSRLAAVKLCRSCDLDLPRDAFRPARKVCMECETEARIERRQAVAA